VKPRLYDAHHTVFVPMKMRPIELQQGFIDLVDRVLSYDQIAKRLIGASSHGVTPKMRLSQVAEMALYYKIAMTLKLKGEVEGLKFLQGLKPYVQRGQISMVAIVVQLDQPDFAVRNRLTLREHRYNLDVPAWETRAATSSHEADSIAAEVAAAVR